MQYQNPQNPRDSYRPAQGSSGMPRRPEPPNYRGERPPQGGGGSGGQGQPPRREPPQKAGNRWFRALFLVLATIGLCVFLAFFIISTANDLFGLNQEDRTIEITVPKGADNGDVAQLLKEAGIVENSFVFRVYAGLKTKERPFLPGTYVFNSNLGYDEIIVALKSGDYEKIEKRITFIEGWTLMDIAKKLEEEEVCDADELIAYLQTADYDYEFFNAIPDEPLRYHRLEGYLFPDTYEFYVGESVQDVSRKFLRNFNNKMTEEVRGQMLEVNLSVDEAVILASIIQKEAAAAEDMALVSSVFHNRMALSQTYPRLQSDVTILYVESDIKPYLDTADQEMYDAYNTYVREALPVGAICNPGMDAIEAALNPAESEFYYFVTDKDGKFYYAATAEEHYRNVAKAKAVGGEAHGVDTQ